MPASYSARVGKLAHMPPRGHYLANEVGRLAGVSGYEIGQWARYGYIRSSQKATIPRVYSYQDVAEAMVVHHLRDTHSFADIKLALAHLRTDRELGDWPLTQADLAVSPLGGQIVRREGGDVVDLTGRPWHGVIDLGDLREIAADLNRGGWAARKLPDLRYIEVNPERLSGRPVVRGHRIAARSVAELAVAGGREVLEDEYELSGDEIYDAQRWWEEASSYEAAA